MKIIKRNLIVTLANENFVSQAKQLFSSVYHNSGWDGDYLLLSQNIPESELAWFRAKGIHVYECDLLSDKPVGSCAYPPIVLSKFYLFKEYFKKWNKVLFLDADIIVRYSLNEMLIPSGFSAPAATINLGDELIETDYQLMKKLKNQYKLSSTPFNSGVFIFDTDLVTDQTFNQIMSLYDEFGSLNVHGEEATLNLYFYENWNVLPIIYNSIPRHMWGFYKLKKDKFIAMIIHFVKSVKPWDERSLYYQEWMNNYHRADNIDIFHPKPGEIYSPIELEIYLKRLARIEYIRSWTKPIRDINRQIGQLGLFIKRKNPGLYKIISLKKDDPEIY